MALSMLCSATQEIPRYELFTKILLTISTKQSFGDCQWATPANVEGEGQGVGSCKFEFRWHYWCFSKVDYLWPFDAEPPDGHDDPPRSIQPLSPFQDDIKTLGPIVRHESPG